MIAMTETPMVEVNENNPTVIYDHANKQIAATVILTYDPFEGHLVALFPLIAIPGSGTGEPLTWTVFWDIKPNIATLSLASFRSDTQGIEIRNLPPRVTLLTSEPILTSEPGQPPALWKVKLENHVDIDSSLHYSLFLQGTRIGETEPMFHQHDPTIAVVPEPIG